MSNRFAFDGGEIELSDAEREALLYLHEGGDLAKSTTVRQACDSIGYQRKVLRVFDSLEDKGLIQTRIDKVDPDGSARKPPRVAMLTSDGEEFVAEHEAALATAEMDTDDLREEVHQLRQELSDVRESLEEQQDRMKSRLDDIDAQNETPHVQSDFEQIETRVTDLETSISQLATHDDLEQAKGEMRDEMDMVRADMGTRINDVQARVGDVESTVDVLEERVDEIDEWTTETDQWIRGTLLPGIRRITPVVEAYEAAQESDDTVDGGHIVRQIIGRRH
ncbi:hypothetical protein [Natrinema sp. SYSU A 869]|uniref:hypothetical protein n=1 Tax=Natrinema sp. SYSU A 869 TaxID=2871694 RepID=UPI001CA40A16|nr:hypothetical protein [Natrinema sp. SYSU A 869]